MQYSQSIRAKYRPAFFLQFWAFRHVAVLWTEFFDPIPRYKCIFHFIIQQHSGAALLFGSETSEPVSIANESVRGPR